MPVGLPDERRLVLRGRLAGRTVSAAQGTAWITASVRPQPPTAETYEFINELGNKKNNVGADWPAARHLPDEPGHFRHFVDGENIIDADYRLFYVHRGMEKLVETRMGYNEVTFLSIPCAWHLRFAHSTAYHLGGERHGIVVPERAQMIRAICWKWNVCTRTC